MELQYYTYDLERIFKDKLLHEILQFLNDTTFSHIFVNFININNDENSIIFTINNTVYIYNLTLQQLKNQKKILCNNITTLTDGINLLLFTYENFNNELIKFNKNKHIKIKYFSNIENDVIIAKYSNKYEIIINYDIIEQCIFHISYSKKFELLLIYLIKKEYACKLQKLGFYKFILWIFKVLNNSDEIDGNELENTELIIFIELYDELNITTENYNWADIKNLNITEKHNNYDYILERFKKLDEFFKKECNIYSLTINAIMPIIIYFLNITDIIGFINNQEIFFIIKSIMVKIQKTYNIELSCYNIVCLNFHVFNEDISLIELLDFFKTS